MKDQDRALSRLTPEQREAAFTRCTDKQLEVLELWSRDFGLETIGRMLGVSRSAARNRKDNALRRMNEHIAAKRGGGAAS